MDEVLWITQFRNAMKNIEDLFRRRRFLLLILKHDSYDYHQNQNQNQKLSLFLSLCVEAFVNHKNNNK